MHPSDLICDADFEAEVLAFDQALAAGQAPASAPTALTTDGAPRLARARSCLERLERDRQEAAADSVVELIALIQAEGLVTAAAPRETSFGRFRLERELGRGGCGIVFLAWDPVLRRHVALKIPRLDVLVRPEARQRFVREGRAAAGLTHPNIIHVLEAGSVGAVCYIASAYCQGPTLARWLADQTVPIPPRDAAELIATVADALQHAHERGVIHRDLKPGNILLAPRQETSDLVSEGYQVSEPIADYLPKVADFGLAKQIVDAPAPPDGTAPQASSAALTRTGHVLGTPGYMAPEQATGKAEDAGPATDVFALGIVLYELLTGKQPFRGVTDVETLQLIVAAEPAPPRSLRSEVPRDLETICLQCLRRQPERRYATMTALADDLRRFLRGEPIAARTASWAERTQLWARRRPAVAALMASTAFAFIVFVAGMFWHFVRLDATNADLQAALVKADQERTRAETGEMRARNLAYASQIDLVDHFRSSRRIPPLRQMLNRLRPGHEEADLRGFEWRYLWNVGGREMSFSNHAATVTSVAFLDDGHSYASIDATGLLMIHDDAARLRGRWDPDTTGWVAGHLSGDGKRVLIVRHVEEAIQLELREWPSRKSIFTRSWPKVDVAYVRLSSDGRMVVLYAWFSESAPALLRIWQPDAGVERVLWSRPRTNVTAVALSRDNRTLAIAYHQSDDPKQAPLGIDCLDVASGRNISSMSANSSFVHALAFAPDGRSLASGETNNQVHIWDVASGRSETVLHDQKGAIACLAYSADGVLLAAGSRARKGTQAAAGVCVWDMRKQGALHCPRFHLGATIASLAFAPDGRSLLVGDDDRHVHLHRLNAPIIEVTLTGHRPAEAWSVAFTPDAATMISGGDDHLLRIWNARTEARIDTLAAHDSLVTNVAVAANGRWFASSSYDKTVRLWDMATLKCLHTFEHPGRQWSVAVSPDSRTLAAVGVDGVVTLWDLTTRQIRHPLPQQVSRVDGAFTPDSRTLVCYSNDRSVTLWDVADGTCRATYYETYPASSVAVAPDGKLIAVGTTDGAISIRRLDTGVTTALLHGHSKFVRTLAFAPDGKTLASGGGDRTVRLWHVATGQELICFKDLPDQVNSVAFAPDGSALAAAIHDGSIRLWRAGNP